MKNIGNFTNDEISTYLVRILITLVNSNLDFELNAYIWSEPNNRYCNFNIENIKEKDNINSNLYKDISIEFYPFLNEIELHSYSNIMDKWSDVNHTIENIQSLNNAQILKVIEIFNTKEILTKDEIY